MAISLEELRRQREQIQRHLDWFDAKIAAHASDQPTTSRDPESPVQAKAPDTTEAAPQTSELPAPAEASAAFQRSDSSLNDDRSESDQPEFKAKTAQELKRAQIGCIALFILATTLFLFLLFGLPYLL